MQAWRATRFIFRPLAVMSAASGSKKSSIWDAPLLLSKRNTRHNAHPSRSIFCPVTSAPTVDSLAAGETVFLVAERLAGFQGVSDAFLSLLFSAERDEGFALEIQDILFVDQLRRRQGTARQNVRELAADMRVVLGGIAPPEHHVDGELRAGKKLFAEYFDLSAARTFLPAGRQRLVAAPHQRQRGFLGVGDQAIAVHRKAIFAAQIPQVAAFLCACADLGHGDGFKDGLQGMEKIEVGFRRRGKAEGGPTGALIRADQ